MPAQAVREGEEVYDLELSDVTFVDVVGVGALGAAARRLPEGGGLCRTGRRLRRAGCRTCSGPTCR
ncbi:hypothetical protein ACIBAI_00840 [Streptomyces sp. NPDC051041]|uniref:hypothetical protein n=1 Tax=Streptomyces sp. NPDC051041 TaxID=3365640 RepID=UPI00379FF82A